MVIHNLSKHQLNPKWNMGALSTPVTQPMKLEQNKLNKNRLKLLCLRISRLGSIDEIQFCFYIIFTIYNNQIPFGIFQKIEWARMNIHQQLSPYHKIVIHVRSLNNIGLKLYAYTNVMYFGNTSQYCTAF